MASIVYTENLSITCPLCGKQIGTPLFKKSGPFQIYICPICKLGQTFPYPQESNGQEHYTDSDDYFERHYTVSRPLWRKYMAIILDTAKPYKSSGTLLDIGANIGFMLELAQERGFKATGVEPSPAANRYARGKLHLNMIEGYFPPPELHDQRFDLITLNHVLEHVPDPLNFLCEIKQHLNPDGVAIIMSPGYTSLMAFILGRKWGGYQPTQHIWQFTPETAAQLAGRAGLQVLQHRKSSLGHHVGSNTLINQTKEVAKIGAFLGTGEQIVVIVKNQ